MRKGKILSAFLAGMILFLVNMSVCMAAETECYRNEETGYRVLLEDEAGLLDGQEQAELAELMKEITEYGNVAFVTTDSNSLSAESYAGNYYRTAFGTDSGILFLIDMQNRKLWIHSDGAVYQVVTVAYAETVTDNIYRYATDGDYLECASEAFREIISLLRGQRIAQPMKYISNLLLAVSLALLINFGLMASLTGIRRRQNKLLGDAQCSFSHTSPTASFTYETKTYSPQSSDSGGSSSGGSSSGGGSSGGSSGGGGGHSF